MIGRYLRVVGAGVAGAALAAACLWAMDASGLLNLSGEAEARSNAHYCYRTDNVVPSPRDHGFGRIDERDDYWPFVDPDVLAQGGLDVTSAQDDLGKDPSPGSEDLVQFGFGEGNFPNRASLVDFRFYALYAQRYAAPRRGATNPQHNQFYEWYRTPAGHYEYSYDGLQTSGAGYASYSSVSPVGPRSSAHEDDGRIDEITTRWLHGSVQEGGYAHDAGGAAQAAAGTQAQLQRQTVQVTGAQGNQEAAQRGWGDRVDSRHGEPDDYGVPHIVPGQRRQTGALEMPGTSAATKVTVQANGPSFTYEATSDQSVQTIQAAAALADVNDPNRPEYTTTNVYSRIEERPEYDAVSHTIGVDPTDGWSAVEGELPGSDGRVLADDQATRAASENVDAYSDGSNDVIEVSILLEGKYREDEYVRYSIRAKNGERNLAELFGGESLYPQYGWQGEGPAAYGDVTKVGYRQPYLVFPGGSYQELDPEIGGEPQHARYVREEGFPNFGDRQHARVMEHLSWVRWPVYLADVNWYLFRVNNVRCVDPDAVDAVGGQGACSGNEDTSGGIRGRTFTLGHSLDDASTLTYWDHSERLVRGGFNKQGVEMPDWPYRLKDSVDIADGIRSCGEYVNEHGQRKDHELVVDPSAATGERIEDKECESTAKWLKREGFGDSGYLPFSMENPRVPLDPGVRHPRDMTELRLSNDDLVKAGVVTPEDAVAGAYSENRTLKFRITENDVYGAGSSQGEGFAKRLGLTEYGLENKGSNHRLTVTDKPHGFGAGFDRGSDGADEDRVANVPCFVTTEHHSCWPRGDMNPNDPYLLVITYYEGDQDGDIKYGRYISNWRVAKKSWHFAANTAGQLDFEAGGMQLVGKVPRYQYRKVICRILVYPMGVEPGQSYYEKATEKIVDKVKGVVNAVKNLGGLLLGWISNFMLGIMKSGVEQVGEAACDGIKAGSSLGGEGRGAGKDDPHVRSKADAEALRGESDCQEWTEEEDSQCESLAVVLEGGECVGIPRVNMHWAGSVAGGPDWLGARAGSAMDWYHMSWLKPDCRVPSRWSNDFQRYCVGGDMDALPTQLGRTHRVWYGEFDRWEYDEYVRGRGYGYRASYLGGADLDGHHYPGYANTPGPVIMRRIDAVNVQETNPRRSVPPGITSEEFLEYRDFDGVEMLVARERYNELKDKVERIAAFELVGGDMGFTNVSLQISLGPGNESPKGKAKIVTGYVVRLYPDRKLLGGGASRVMEGSGVDFRGQHCPFHYRLDGQRGPRFAVESMTNVYSNQTSGAGYGQGLGRSGSLGNPLNLKNLDQNCYLMGDPGEGALEFYVPRYFNYSRLNYGDPLERSASALQEFEFIQFGLMGMIPHQDTTHGSLSLEKDEELKSVNILGNIGFSEARVGYHSTLSQLDLNRNALDNFGFNYAEGEQAVGAYDYYALISQLHDLPVTAGYKHGISVAAFAGIPGEDSYREGPASDVFEIDGQEAACGAQNMRMVAAWAEADPNQDLWEPGVKRNRFELLGDDNASPTTYLNYRAGYYGVGPGHVTYNAAVAHGCISESGEVLYRPGGRAVIRSGLDGSVPDDVGAPSFVLQSGVGLLGGFEGFLHNDFCSGFFSGTPANLTWNNHIVRNAWSLVWVVASLGLLVIMIIQAIRLIYDMWLNNRSSLGLREALPRILFAVVVSGLSLWLMQVLFVLVKDLTCYVAQATGTTFWSTVAVIGDVLLAMLGWITAWIVATMVIGLVPVVGQAVQLASLIIGVVILLTLIIFLGIVFLIVFFHMLLRTFLLAVLIAIAPAALILLASEQTAHWTKRWFSILMGTLFQQVVVLLVLYVGKAIFVGDGGFNGGAVTGSDGVNFTSVMFGLLGLLLISYLAVKVPRIVNPEGAGIFSGFAQMLGMAGTIAMTAVAVGGAGLAGAAGAVPGGAGGAGGTGPAAGGARAGAAGATETGASGSSTVGANSPSSGWGERVQGGGRTAGNTEPGGNSPSSPSMPAGGRTPSGGGDGGSSGTSGVEAPSPGVSSEATGTSGAGSAPPQSGWDRVSRGFARVVRGGYEAGRAEASQPHEGGVRGYANVLRNVQQSRRQQGERARFRDIADEGGM